MSTHTIKPIRSKADYNAALKRVEALISKNPKKGSAAYDELDVLVTLLAAYEDIHYPILAPNPILAVKYLMESEGLKPKDLVTYFGSKGNVSEFFSGKRNLSIRVMKALHERFNLPYELMIV